MVFIVIKTTYLFNCISIKSKIPQEKEYKCLQNIIYEAVLGCKPLFNEAHEFEKRESLY